MAVTESRQWRNLHHNQCYASDCHRYSARDSTGAYVSSDQVVLEGIHSTSHTHYGHFHGVTPDRPL